MEKLLPMRVIEQKNDRVVRPPPRLFRVKNIWSHINFEEIANQSHSQKQRYAT